MNTVDLNRLVEALTEIATLLDKLGVPGLVALALLGPALVLGIFIAAEYHRGRRMQDMIDRHVAESRVLLETYRADTQQVLRELGAGLDQTEQFYRDNVELVRQYERIAKGLQDVVVSNTRAMERLITMLESRQK